MNLSDMIKNGSVKGYELLTLTSNYTLNISKNNVFEIKSTGAYTISIPNDNWTGQEIILFNTSGYDIKLNLNDSNSKSCILKHNNIYRVLSLKNDDIDELICLEEQEQYLIDYSSYAEHKIMASDVQADDRFGKIQISGDGNTIVVTAHKEDTGGTDAGAAYVFIRSGSTWTQQAKLQSNDIEAGDDFGYNACAITEDGNTCVIGARLEDTGGTDAGAAYVFTRSGNTWTQQQKLQSNDIEAGDNFGVFCDINADGNTCVIGAYCEDTGGNNAGAAYIFTRSGSTWTQQAKLMASDAEVKDLFGIGCSISSNGNTCIIGAWTEDTGGTDAGAAYVFIRSGSTWSQQAKLQSNDIEAGDQFGHTVSISGDGNTCLVMALYEDTGGTDAGAAYIFTRSGSTWTQQAKLMASDVQAGDLFGLRSEICSTGDVCVICSEYEDTGGTDAGAAYIFTRSGNTWTQQAKLQSNDIEAGDQFGSHCSISGDGNTCVIGAQNEDTGGTDAGAAYIFDFNL